MWALTTNPPVVTETQFLRQERGSSLCLGKEASTFLPPQTLPPRFDSSSWVRRPSFPPPAPTASSGQCCQFPQKRHWLATEWNSQSLCEEVWRNTGRDQEIIACQEDKDVSLQHCVPISVHCCILELSSRMLVDDTMGNPDGPLATTKSPWDSPQGRKSPELTENVSPPEWDLVAETRTVSEKAHLTVHWQTSANVKCAPAETQNNAIKGTMLLAVFINPCHFHTSMVNYNPGVWNGGLPLINMFIN